MTLRDIFRIIVLAAFTSAIAATAHAQPADKPRAGPVDEPRGAMRQQLWWVPIAAYGETLMLETTVYRPAGQGPFPIAILSHGSPRDVNKRREEGRTTWTAQSQWFLSQGYAVAIPMRRGYANSEGGYVEDYGGCRDADYRHAGLNSAVDILGALAYFQSQPFIAPKGALLVGQSAGGWGTLAASRGNPPGVAALLIFAAGRGSVRPGENCQPDRLVEAARQWGREARVPTLWFSAENDSYFNPDLTKRMTEAYRAGGAPVTYTLMPAFRSDGHSLFSHREGVPIWSPVVEGFLRALPR